jgi:hypothetical protein
MTSHKWSLAYAFHLKSLIHFSPHRPGFDPSVAYVGFMSENVVLEQVFLRGLSFYSFSITPPMVHTHIHLSALDVTRFLH